MRYLFLSFAVALAACGQSPDPAPLAQPTVVVEKPSVYTVNYPLAWAAEQLVDEAATVVFPAPADGDPAFWEPDLEVIAGYQQADLVLLNGAGYAKWIERVSLSENSLVDTSAAFVDQLITVDSGPVHSHGPEGEHSHGERAFTTWLDLSLFAAQVDASADALAQRMPEQAAAIGEQQSALGGMLEVWDMELAAAGAQLDDAPLLYSHPVYQYLQRRYELNGVSLHWEPDQTPDESDWAELDRILSSHPARLMLWEDEPTPATRAGLKERGVAVVVFSPMGNRPADGDFASGMLANIRALSEAASGVSSSN